MANYGSPGGQYPGSSSEGPYSGSSPGGQYPGSAPEPWSRQDGESTGAYGQPADPWAEHNQPGGNDHWGGSPLSVPPTAPGLPASQPGYPYPGSAPGYPGSGSGYPEPGAGYGAPERAGGPMSPPPGWRPTEPEPMWGTPPADPNWSTPQPLPAPKRSVGRLVAMGATALVVLAIVGTAIGLYVSGRQTQTPNVLPSTGPSEEPVVAESPEVDESSPGTPAAAPSTDARFVKPGQCVANEGTARRPVLVITECAPKTYEVLARIDEPTTGEDDAKTKCAKVENYTNYYFFNSDLDDLDFVLCLRQR